MEQLFLIQVNPDLPDVLDDSEIFRRRIESELAKEGTNAKVQWERNPLSTEADRDLVLLVLAAGATSVMVGTAVKRVIDALNRGKPTVVVEKEFIPMLGQDGKPVHDSKGKPLYQVKETPHVHQTGHENDSMSLRAGTVFEFRSGSGPSGARDSSGADGPHGPGMGPSLEHGKST